MSKSVNVVIVEGGVVREPELKYTGNGVGYVRFAIAHAGYGNLDRDEVSYFEVVAWNKLAEICSSYLKKGRRIIVSGTLRQNRWEDETGQKKNRVVIVASDVKFIPSQRRSSNNQPNNR